jgi:hypothetical protein
VVKKVLRTGIGSLKVLVVALDGRALAAIWPFSVSAGRDGLVDEFGNYLDASKQDPFPALP